MLIIKVNPDSPEPDKIKQAAELIIAGKLVAFPTETVYGLGANAQDEKAIKRIYQVKRRPDNKPLTLHIADIKQFKQFVGEPGKELDIVIRKFWPGPLALIVKDHQGKKTGVRMPDNKIALSLIKEAGVPLVVPSANISGRKAPVTATEVVEQLGNKIDLVLDGGPSRIGVSSTVVDMSTCPYSIIREGAISRSELVNSGLEIA